MPPSSAPVVGLIAPYITGVYYGAILSGVQQAARNSGAGLAVIHQPAGSHFPLRIAHHEIDGWIVTLNTHDCEPLAESGKPLVTISVPLPSALQVQPDNHGGEYTVVRHLIEHGHRRIAFVGNLASSDLHERFLGYKAALEAAGIALDPQLVIATDSDDIPGGRAGGEALRARGVPCTAIAAGTDLLACGVVEVLSAAGYRFPDDLAIVGFDDILRAQTHDPPLTTVRQPFGAIGSRALDELVALLGGAAAPAGPACVETTLIVRRSCGCAGHTVAQGELDPEGLAGDAWADRLGERLVRLLTHVRHQTTSAPWSGEWPSARELIDALEGVARGGELPAVSLFEQFWGEALRISADLTSLNSVLTALEDAGRRRHEIHGAGAMAGPRLLTMFESLREVLLRTCVAAEARHIQYLDQIMNANLEVSNTLLGSGATQSTDLRWLRHMDAAWGYLGLWSSDDMSSLTIAASYSSTGTHPSLTGQVFRTEAFPPRHLLLSQGREEEISLMMPVRSPSREWGLLLLGGPLKAQIYSTASPTEIWAGMLGTELDRAQALADLRQQQASLQSAYERERALASTIRELSCPTIPLLPGVLLLPLVGTIDSERARLIIQAVLEEVGRTGATEVLIDVTGVPMIDSQVANVLVQMAKMISLLGARSTLVGVRPEIAQSIVGLGADLSSISTSPSLASVLATFVRGPRGRSA